MTNPRALVFAMALIFSACSADSVEQNVSAPATTSSTTTTTEAVQTEATSSSVAPTSSVSPPTEEQSAAASPATVPVALAFRSEADIGGLYETKTRTGLLGTSTAPASSFSGITVSDGTLVEVKEVARLGSQLWVLIAAPIGDTSDLGWTLASDLVDTEQVAIDRPWSLVRRFSRIVPAASGGDAVVIRNLPNLEGEIVSEPSTLDVLHTGGNRARAATGDSYVELTLPGSDDAVGWILEANIERIESLTARYGDGSVAPLANPGLWPIGAQVSRPFVVGGCGSIQVTIATASRPDEGVGSHVRFGSTRPTATWTGEAAAVQWTLGPDEREFFVRPGGAVTLTIPSAQVTSWFFMAMGAANDAAWLVDEEGEPVLGPGDALQPVRFDEIAIDTNGCSATVVG